MSVLETTGFWYKRCIIRDRLEGKVALVTGANTGLGLAIVGELARRGAKVIMACRNRERAEQGKRKLLDLYGAQNPNCLTLDVADGATSKWLNPIAEEQLQIEVVDLSSLDSIHQFAERILHHHEQLHLLINNAGLVSPYEVTKAGHEMTMAVNYLGHFLLTELLLPLLKKSAPSRIVVIGSRAHLYTDLCKPDLHMPQSNYSGIRAYSQSKLANVMHAKELGNRLSNSGVLCVSVCPGPVSTELGRDMPGIVAGLFRTVMNYTFPSPWQGAQTVMFAVFSPSLEQGGFYFNCALSRVHPAVNNDEERQWLWEKSSELVHSPKQYVGAQPSEP